jgi:HEPN domain-containing protein
MTEPLPAHYAEKHSIIKELFVNTADDNYIVARMCFHANLDVDFFWLAVHCLEKYLKAVLLHNGRSAKPYRHDIVKLYNAVRPLAPELLPEALVRPDGMPSNLWREETAANFIQRLYRDGQADNRYQLYGYVRRAEDLWKFDSVVFNVRRLCQPLEMHFLMRPRPGTPDESKRKLMSTDGGSWKLYGKLEETIDGKHGETLQHALLNWNRPFAPSGYHHTEMDYRSSWREPVFIRRLFDPLRGGPQNFKDADELWEWVRRNIQLPKGLIEDIEKGRQELKSGS